MRTTSIAIIALTCFFIQSCKKKEKDPTPQPTPIVTPCTPSIVNVTGDITSPTVWKECFVYVVGPTAISISSTLTIEPGAIIKVKGSAGDNAILISNSGMINANGTADKPIVFTSFADDANGGDSNGDGTATTPARYDWGGIIINSNTCQFNYCNFMYGGKGPQAGTGQPTLEFSYFYGSVNHCTFAYCGGEDTYAGYGVVDARSCENPNFVITNSTFYGCIKPLFLNPHNSIDASNMFHNPNNLAEKNQLNGIFMTSTSNEATTDVTWLESEVPFVLTGSTGLGDGLKLILGENVIIKVALLPAKGFNLISIKEGLSEIQGHDLAGVYFTSYLDDDHGGDTNGDGSATIPSKGDWYGVLDNSATIGTNNHCYNWPNILYATYP